MLTKIISLLILISVWYWVTVFVAPEIASKIDTAVGFPGFSENITWVKSNIDGIVTDIPSVAEFKSGALDIKDTVTNGVATTKETIDSIRGGAQKVESTYNDARDVVENINGKVTDIKNTLDDVGALWNSISNVVNTDLVEEIDSNN